MSQAVFINPKTVQTNRYRGVVALQSKNKDELIIVMKSKNPCPYNWSVCKAFHSAFFQTYREAMDYCKSRGYHIAST